MDFKIYEENGQVVSMPASGNSLNIVFPPKYYSIDQYLSAAVDNTSYVSVTDPDGNYLFYRMAPSTFVKKDGTTTYGASASDVVTALNLIFDQKNYNDFIIKDSSADFSGTTKIIHKEDRDNGGTLELDLHASTIGLYDSYLKITETSLTNFDKDTAFGRLEIYLQNRTTSHQAVTMTMGNIYTPPVVDFNFATLDISGVVTFSGTTSGIDYGDINNTPASVGIPTGGSINQLLVKASSTDGDASWSSALSGSKTRYVRVSSWGSGAVEGHVAYWGSGTNDTVAGKIYVKTSAGAWAGADNKGTNSKGILAMGLGASSSVHGMLLWGFYYTNAVSGMTTGSPIYLSASAGILTTTAPTSTGEYSRTIGHVEDSSTNTLFFNPSSDYTVVT